MIRPVWPLISLTALHAGAELAAELVHLHHAGRDGVLHQADHVLDVQGGHGRLVGQAADFAGDDEESAAVLRPPSPPRWPR